MCDQLLFIDAGRIVHHGSTESLVQHQGVEILVEIRVSGDLESLYNWIAASLDVDLVDRMNNGVRVRVSETANLSSLLRRLVLDGVEVCGFFKIERRLEDAFVDMLRTKPPPIP